MIWYFGARRQPRQQQRQQQQRQKQRQRKRQHQLLHHQYTGTKRPKSEAREYSNHQMSRRHQVRQPTDTHRRPNFQTWQRAIESQSRRVLQTNGVHHQTEINQHTKRCEIQAYTPQTTTTASCVISSRSDSQRRGKTQPNMAGDQASIMTYKNYSSSLVPNTGLLLTTRTSTAAGKTTPQLMVMLWIMSIQGHTQQELQPQTRIASIIVR